MSDKIDPVKYAENIMKAWQANDEKAVESIEEKYGEQEVKLKDLENMFAYMMSVLSTGIMVSGTVSSAMFNSTMDILVESETISKEKREEVDVEIEDLVKKLEGEDK